MRILFNTQPLSTGHNVRGTGVYTRNLLDAMQKIIKGSKHSIKQFTDSTKIHCQSDIIHFPYFDPFFLTLPNRLACPYVVTVHDLIPIAYQNHFKRGIRGEIKWQIQKRRVRHATRIITDSFSSKEDIVKYVGYPHEKIDVIYLAPHQSICVKSQHAENRPLSYGIEIRQRYFIYVGDINWNKNIAGLLHAFSELKRDPSYSDVIFIFVGDAFAKNNLFEMQGIRALISAYNLGKYIRMPGYISQSDLIRLICHASCSFQISFAEGFGLPVLDAMALGCPVVTSNTSSLKEIAGPSHMVNPWKTTEIVEAMKSILSMTQANRDVLVEKGKRWAERFTWEKTAQKTLISYEKALA